MHKAEARMRSPIAVLFVALLVPTSITGEHLPAAAMSCAELASLALPNTTITKAEAIAAGAFTLPAPNPPAPPAGPPAPLQAFQLAPAFCRVAATIKPSPDSDIKIEVWLPATGWNGKFVGARKWRLGRHDHLSVRSPSRFAAAMRSRRPIPDIGNGGDGSFAFDHPEKLIDFGYRAVHEMTVQAKAVITTHYGTRAAALVLEWLFDRRPPGPHGGTTLPRRLRRDGHRRTGELHGRTCSRQSLWAGLATLKSPASLIPREKYPTLIHDAVIQACDRRRRCRRRRARRSHRVHVRSKSAAVRGRRQQLVPDCTAGGSRAQHLQRRAAIRRQALKFSRASNAAARRVGRRSRAVPRPLSIANDYFRYVVFKNPAWDFKTLDFDEGRRVGRENRQRHARCGRSESASVLQPRWKGAHVSRLERSADFAAQQHQLLHERRENARCRQGGRIRFACSWSPA